jgi:hypothetical protein
MLVCEVTVESAPHVGLARGSRLLHQCGCGHTGIESWTQLAECAITRLITFKRFFNFIFLAPYTVIITISINRSVVHLHVAVELLLTEPPRSDQDEGLGRCGDRNMFQLTLGVKMSVEKTGSLSESHVFCTTAIL